jgi:hypothetical protein
MKLIALIALLLISNCAAISFVSAVDDFAWQVAVSHDSSIIASDLKLTSKFTENKDLIGAKKYCDLVAIDIQAALEHSQKYNVSSKLLDEKYYYEMALENMGIGAETASRGYALGDTPQGNSFLNTAAGYMNLGTQEFQELNNLTSVEPITQTIIYESPAGKHSCAIGTPGISEFIINWTDSKNYVTLDKAVNDATGSYEGSSESWTETIFDLTASAANDTNDNHTLTCEITWHPTKKNRSKAPVFESDESESRSTITIQGKKAVLVKFKERKLYQGSNSPPSIIPASFFVSYFADDYTEVAIRAPASKWKDSDFNNAMSSLKITPPAGYY